MSFNSPSPGRRSDCRVGQVACPSGRTLGAVETSHSRSDEQRRDDRKPLPADPSAQFKE